VFKNRVYDFLGTNGRSHQSATIAPWRQPAKLLVSLALLYHISAILAGAVGGHPSSPIEHKAANFFRYYFGFVNQGYAYRYYAKLDTTVDPHHPHPWSTPVVTLEMEFSSPEGVRQEVYRLPRRERLWPRLRFQRELDLAYHLTSDPRWVGTYARHLCKKLGCTKVTVYTQEHQIPDLALVRAAASGTGDPVDLEAESTYAHRVKLGEFKCTDF
jgi:hypothetical protein